MNGIQTQSTRTVYGAAIALGIFVSTLVAVVLVAVLWLADAPMAWWRAMIAAPALGSLACGWYGIRWTIGFANLAGLHYYSPPVKISVGAVEAEPVPAAVEDVPAEADAAVNASRLNDVLLRIIDLHYNEKKQATRPECEAVGINQAEWNAANRVLQAAGLKGARSWHDEYDYVQARRLFNGRVSVRDGAIWIGEGPMPCRSWKRL